jgi:hypothetical protein
MTMNPLRLLALSIAIVMGLQSMASSNEQEPRPVPPSALTSVLAPPQSSALAPAPSAHTGPFLLVYIAANGTNAQTDVVRKQLVAVNWKAYNATLVAFTAQPPWKPAKELTDRFGQFGAPGVFVFEGQAVISVVKPPASAAALKAEIAKLRAQTK